MRKALRAWADDAAEFAIQLARIDPSWGSVTFALAGGQVVLCGPGMYVNRALACGLDGPLSEADMIQLEARSTAVGVPAALEITEATHPDVIEQLTLRGYLDGASTAALRRRLDDLDQLPDPDPTIVIRSANTDLLPLWQATSALGWGHLDNDARRASDAFSRAAALVDGEGLVLATDAHDGRPLGCASLTVRDGVATLGGMSTLPAERGRGVQRALIHHRLRVAARRGCEIATTSAAPGGVSERNLIRHGFDPWFAVTTKQRDR